MCLFLFYSNMLLSQDYFCNKLIESVTEMCDAIWCQILAVIVPFIEFFGKNIGTSQMQCLKQRLLDLDIFFLFLKYHSTQKVPILQNFYLVNLLFFASQTISLLCTIFLIAIKWSSLLKAPKFLYDISYFLLGMLNTFYNMTLVA